MNLECIKGEHRPVFASLGGDVVIIGVDGHYVVASSDIVSRVERLVELQVAQRQGAAIGIGYYLDEAVADFFIRSDFGARRLYSLCHADIDIGDVFLLRSCYFGWNVVLYRNRVVGIDLALGHVDLKKLTAEDYQAMLQKQNMIEFDSLQEALDALGPASFDASVVDGGVNRLTI